MVGIGSVASGDGALTVAAVVLRSAMKAGFFGAVSEVWFCAVRMYTSGFGGGGGTGAGGGMI